MKAEIVKAQIKAVIQSRWPLAENIIVDAAKCSATFLFDVYFDPELLFPPSGRKACWEMSMPKTVAVSGCDQLAWSKWSGHAAKTLNESDWTKDAFYWDESDFHDKSFMIGSDSGLSGEYSYSDLSELILLEGFCLDNLEEEESMIKENIRKMGNPVPNKIGLLGMFFDLEELRKIGRYAFVDDREIIVSGLR